MDGVKKMKCYCAISYFYCKVVKHLECKKKIELEQATVRFLFYFYPFFLNVRFKYKLRIFPINVPTYKFHFNSWPRTSNRNPV